MRSTAAGREGREHHRRLPKRRPARGDPGRAQGPSIHRVTPTTPSPSAPRRNAPDAGAISPSSTAPSSNSPCPTAPNPGPRARRANTVPAQAAAKNPSTQRFTYISADVSAPDYAAPLLAEAIAWNDGQPPDVVWCVAGMSTPGIYAETDFALTRRNMDVNFYGQAEMAHAVLRHWLSPDAAAGPRAPPKHLVFTTSVVVFFTIVGYGPYAPAKWAVRGLADTLSQEVLLYPDNPVKVHVVYPGTILSPGLQRENSTKPQITHVLEKDDPQQTPDDVAAKAIRGLERGQYFVTVSWLGDLMKWGTMGGSLRNNWLVDTLMMMFVPLIWIFVLPDILGKIRKFGKQNGHPSTYANKVEKAV